VPELLDLFCGGFGAGHGYQRAGFTVTGVDMVTRADRPDGVAFIKADVLDVLADLEFIRGFDLVHASPPCKVHTRLGHLITAAGKTPVHGDLVGVTRDALDAAGVPYIIENVEGAPVRPDVVLCGTMLGLHSHDSEGRKRWLRRHRLFELGDWGHLGFGVQPEWCCDCQAGCTKPMCGHRVAGYRAWGVYGSLADEVPGGGQTPETLAQARELMGTPWMSWSAITQAIPPAYTEYLGRMAREELGL
jgi:DNA (cytosine-5)-methyltransferase 1